MCGAAGSCTERVRWEQTPVLSEEVGQEDVWGKGAQSSRTCKGKGPGAESSLLCSVNHMKVPVFEVTQRRVVGEEEKAPKE